MRYEVRTEFVQDADAGIVTVVVETSRTDRKTAESDVEILKFLGKKAWIVEVDS